MKLAYTVSTEGESGKGYWYTHKIAFPGIPCMIDGRSTFSASKRYALENAAMMQGLPFKDYMTLRKESRYDGGGENYVPREGAVT